MIQQFEMLWIISVCVNNTANIASLVNKIIIIIIVVVIIISKWILFIFYTKKDRCKVR